MNRFRIAALIGAAALLKACGGDPDAGLNNANREVPASALSSAAAFTQFVAAQAAEDHRQPAELTGVGEAPQSETEAPVGAR